MSPSPLVVAERLTKRYGSRLAVNDVSFQIAHGEIVGLLGPNGSGKTSILRMLSGFLAPSAGSALIEGEDVSAGALSLRAKIGYVPEDGPAYDHMRVGEYLRFAAAIKGIPRSRIASAVDEVLDRLALTEVARLLISKLSRGYRQRVALAQGMIHKPKLLILDEPTNGLDPYQVIELRELVRLLAGIPAKINLIPFNPWPGTVYECSDWEYIERFSDIVNRAGYASPIRTPRGRDILAACGQLKSESERMRIRERLALEAMLPSSAE